MKRFFIIGGIVALGIFLRLIPHVPNVAPLSALALFSGYAIHSRWGMLLAPLASLVADVSLGMYELPVMLSVYGSYIAIYIIGRYTSPAVVPVAHKTITSSLLFFFATNGAVWAFTPWYAKTAAGLLLTYVNGVPFLFTSLIGDLLYGQMLLIVFLFVLQPKKITAPLPHSSAEVITHY